MSKPTTSFLIANFVKKRFCRFDQPFLRPFDGKERCATVPPVV